MTRRKRLCVLFAICLVSAAADPGGVFGQEGARLTVAPAQASRAGRGGAQVVVRSFLYVVPDSKRGELARRFPELVSWLGKGGSRAGGFAPVAELKAARVGRRLRDAERAGLVEVRSSARGLVRDGETFALAAGADFGVAQPRLGVRGRRGADLVSRSVGQRLRVTPTVSGGGAAAGRVIELAVSLDLESVDSDSIPSAPVINRNSISTTFSVRSGGVAVVGGVGAVRGGRVYFALGGEAVEEGAGVGPGVK